MKPLDPIVVRLFPSLAKYANKMRLLGLLAIAVITYTIGFHNGLLVGTYRGRVADESYNHMVIEFGQFKGDYLERFGRGLKTTKAQAQVITQKHDDRRNGSTD